VRVNHDVAGEEVAGPKVQGRLRPVGADWRTIRRDGVGVLDVRATIETDDGVPISVWYSGIADFGENGYEEAVHGRAAARSATAICISPRFQTSHPNDSWLNRTHCLSIGRRYPERSEVAYNLYAGR
jgi:Protein of unknown function (DUF3237)